MTIKAEKVDNFVFRQKFSPKDEFKSKVFDQIWDVCLFGYTEAVRKEIQNEELDCIDGVANNVLRGFDLLKEKILETGNWALKTANNIQFQGKLENLSQS